MASNNQQIDWDQIHHRLAAVEEAIDNQRGEDQRRQLLQRRADRYRREKRRGITRTIELVVFRRCDHRYAVRLDELEEIRKSDTIQPLPGVSPTITGVINLRGEIVAVHDLAAFRGHTPGGDADEPWVVVAHTPAAPIALAADHVDGVRSPNPDDIRPVPLSLDSRHGEFQGVFDESILVLDFNGLTENPDFFQA